MIYASAVRRIIQASGIQYVGGNVVATASFDTTGLTGGIGTQAEAGDFILVYRFKISAMPTPAGFSQVVGRAQTSTSLKTYLSVDYRVAAAAGESFTSDSTFLTMMVFRGVGGVESFADNAAVSGVIAPPAVTPVAAGAIIVAGGASNNTVMVNSPPAGALYSVVHAPNNGADIGMCVGTAAAWTATGTNSNASRCSASIVLAPA